jgi:subtilisin family serine protease
MMWSVNPGDHSSAKPGSPRAVPFAVPLRPFVDHTDLVKLTALMKLTTGRPHVKVGLIDGPVALDHPQLARESIRVVPGAPEATCSFPDSLACSHGTFVAGMFAANRGSDAPAICPGCILLVRPIFRETSSRGEAAPNASPGELGRAIVETVNAGATVINLSAALTPLSRAGQKELEEALDYAASRGVLAVAAGGNQGTLMSSAITRHPWVIPVVACDLQGRPIRESNLGHSIGKRGLCAPGDRVTSLGPGGKPLTFGGTSAAAPFVTGTIALLMSAFPAATAAHVKLAVTQARGRRRSTVVPPLLDAWAACEALRNAA